MIKSCERRELRVNNYVLKLIIGVHLALYFIIVQQQNIATAIVKAIY